MGRSDNRLILHDQFSALGNGGRGAYVLALNVAEDARITVGKLGVLAFDAGAYAYVGSALGSAGFQRICRHIGVFAGYNKKLKWHIDYLSTIATLYRAYLIATDKRVECEIAKCLNASPTLTAITRFGASDCTCTSHLFHSANLHRLERELEKTMHHFEGQTCCLKLADV